MSNTFNPARSSGPEFLVCLECETPCYTFEWNNSHVTEILCQVCGNDEPDDFAALEDIEAIESHWEKHRK